MKRSRIRRRCLRTKRVSRQSGFTLECHAQSIQEKEGEIEKTITTKQIDRKKKVHMHEKSMNI